MGLSPSYGQWPGILIETAAAVHEDVGEMVSVDNRVKHQGLRSSVSNTSQAVRVIEGDRRSQPVVRCGYDGLYSVCVSERAFAPSLGYVSRVDHVYYFYLWWEFFCPPVFGWRGSSSSSLGVSLPLCSAFNLPACLKTQHSLCVWFAGLSGVP